MYLVLIHDTISVCSLNYSLIDIFGNSKEQNNKTNKVIPDINAILHNNITKNYIISIKSERTKLA